MIVDASVAAKWILNEDGSEEAWALKSRSDLRAPSLILAEIANVMWLSVKAGRIEAERAGLGLEQIVPLFDGLYEIEPLAGDALRIALEIGHPAYDCLYLALARQLGEPVITADRRLLAAASRAADLEVRPLTA